MLARTAESAAGATILPGVTIAPGWIIGASALATKSTEPNSVYKWIPAKRDGCDLPWPLCDETVSTVGVGLGCLRPRLELIALLPF